MIPGWHRVELVVLLFAAVIGLVLATTAVVAVVAVVVVVARAVVPGLGWAGALMLGAIVSPPDAVARCGPRSSSSPSSSFW